MNAEGASTVDHSTSLHRQTAGLSGYDRQRIKHATKSQENSFKDPDYKPLSPEYESQLLPNRLRGSTEIK